VSDGRFGSPLLLVTSLVGAASFLYPFFLPALAGVGAQRGRGGVEVPLLFTALGVASLVLVLVSLGGRAEGHAASKTVALLGILVALDATLRLVPTVLGASPIFLLIILVGFTFGAEMGFLMGALTLAGPSVRSGGSDTARSST
jgi:energy-coupling factor transport system substrate-specific component